MRKITMFLLTISLAFVLAACGNNNNDNNTNEATNNNNNNNENEVVNNNGENNGNDESEGLVSEEDAEEAEDIVLNDDEKADEDEVVLKVNDSEITGDEYNFTYLNAKVHMAQNGLDPEDAEQAKELTMGSIVEQEVMKQEGEKEGIKVSEEEVNEEFEAAKEESGDDLLSFLDERGISEETYKKVLTSSMIRQQYLDTIVTPGEVTDEEIEEAYEMLKESDPEMPELEEVRDQLEEILIGQNEQEQVQVKVKELIDAAEVEELI